MQTRMAMALSLLLLAQCSRPNSGLDASANDGGAEDSSPMHDARLDVALDAGLDAAFEDARDVSDVASEDRDAQLDASVCVCSPGFECVDRTCAPRDWARVIDPVLVDGITSTTDGAVVIVGRILSGSFRHGAVTLPRATGAFTNVFLARWTRAGAVDAARVVVSAPGATVSRITAAPNGGVYVAFELAGPVLFDTGMLTPTAARDVVVARLDRDLLATSAAMIGGSASKSLTAIAQRGDGVALSFDAEGAVSIDGDAVLDDGGGSVLVAFDAALSPVARRGFARNGPSGSTAVQAQSAAASGAVHAVATLTGSYDFGAGAVTSAMTTPVWLSLDPMLRTRASVALGQPSCGALAARSMNVSVVANDDVLVSVSSWCPTTFGSRSLAHRGLQDVHAYWASATGAVTQASSYASEGSDQHAPATRIEGGALVPVSVDGIRGADFGGGPISSRLRAMTLVRTDERGAYVAHRVINGDGSTQALLSANGANNTAALVLMVDITDTVLGESVPVGGEFGRTVIARAGVDR